MVTIKYKGMELKEFTSDKPTFIDPPVSGLFANAELTPGREGKLFTFDPRFHLPYTDEENRCWNHFFVLPETPKFRRATWKELAYWLIDGKGLVIDENTSRVDTCVFFNRVDLDAEVSDYLKVMRRDDTDWHEPTVDYMEAE